MHGNLYGVNGTLVTDPFSSFEDAPFELLLSRVLSQYSIVGTIGQGATATVFRAYHEHLRRDVAIKAINVRTISRHDSVERFQRETEAIGTVSHPNVVHAYEAGQVGPWCYIIMDYVKGISLMQAIHDQGRIECNEACAIACQVVRGLQSLETNGLVHRDLKPSNIMLTKDGTVKIVDMGLSSMTERVLLTKSGDVMGTPDYTAPEQIKDARHVDVRADIYSLGCVLYEMVTGTSVLSSDRFSSSDAKFLAHTAGEAVARVSNDDSVPQLLKPLLTSMLAVEPENRMGDLIQLEKELESLASGADVLRLIPKRREVVEDPQPASLRDPVATSGVRIRWRRFGIVLVAITLVVVGLLVNRTGEAPTIQATLITARSGASNESIWVHDGGNRLSINAPNVHLASMEDIELNHGTISMTISSMAKQGRWGFFWGYRKIDGKDVYERLVMNPIDNEFTRDRYRLNVENTSSTVVLVGQSRIPVSDAPSYRFTLTVKNKQVTGVYINGKDYPELVSILQEEPTMFGTKKWGLVVRVSSADVYDVVVNDTSYRFKLNEN